MQVQKFEYLMNRLSKFKKQAHSEKLILRAFKWAINVDFLGKSKFWYVICYVKLILPIVATYFSIAITLDNCRHCIYMLAMLYLFLGQKNIFVFDWLIDWLLNYCIVHHRDRWLFHRHKKQFISQRNNLNQLYKSLLIL